MVETCSYSHDASPPFGRESTTNVEKCWQQPGTATRGRAPLWGRVSLLVHTIFLVLAAADTFTIHRQVAMSREAEVAPRRRSLAALVLLLLWAGVSVSGRLIGYV